MPRALLEHDVGDFSEGEAFIDRIVELLRTTKLGPTIECAWPTAAFALIARTTGDTKIFDWVSTTADIVINSRPVTPFSEAFARIGKGIFAVLENDPVLAGEQYNSLGLIRGIHPWLVSGDRVLGLLAHTIGNLAPAISHFEEALSLCRKAGYRPELAWTCCDYADTLLQRNEPGDREKAMSLLDESLAISSELGMRPLMERVLSRRDILKA